MDAATAVSQQGLQRRVDLSGPEVAHAQPAPVNWDEVHRIGMQIQAAQATRGITQPADQFLQEAIDTMRKRAADRDVNQERAMIGTVAAFNAIYGTQLTEAQGWAFMVLLKMKRAATGGYRADDYVDGAAYMGLLGESRSAE